MVLTAYGGDQRHSHYLYPTFQRANHILIVTLHEQAFNIDFYGIFTTSYTSHIWVLYFIDHLLRTTYNYWTISYFFWVQMWLCLLSLGTTNIDLRHIISMIEAWVVLSTGLLSQYFYHCLVFLGLSQIWQERFLDFFFYQVVIWPE